MKPQKTLSLATIFVIISGLFFCFLLFSCSPSLITLPNIPYSTDQRADYSNYTLYISNFDVIGIEDSKDIERVSRLKKRLITYLESQNNFSRIGENLNMVDQSQPYLIMNVKIRPTYTAYRTWIIDIMTFYPFLGLWPFTPIWGKTRVDLEIEVFDSFNNAVDRFSSTKQVSYAKLFYSYYNNKPMDEAFQKCYATHFNDLSLRFKNYNPQIVAFVDSIFYANKSVNNKESLLIAKNDRKRSVAVVELDAYGISETESFALTNRLTSELFKTYKFNVLEREKMQEILTEQGFQMSGCTTSECLVEVGKLLNVQQMVGGSISKIGGYYTVELRLIDVETGKILSVANEDIDGDIGVVLKNGMRRAVLELIR